MKITLLDASILLTHVRQGKNLPDVGFEDADNTYNELVKVFNRHINIPIEMIESALWSCTMLQEKGLFKHPENMQLQAFAYKLRPEGYRYNPDLCLFEKVDP